ncbi:hypothetical protein [Okeania sp.]|nr:hypothetical protein [Okeania sp.]MEB3342106.1 hypothetical protein [Okeania sp.]
MTENLLRECISINYRAFDLYHKPVISLAILGDENQSWRPSFYQYGFGKS